jgi:hypothetical protein
MRRIFVALGVALAGAAGLVSGNMKHASTHSATSKESLAVARASAPCAQYGANTWQEVATLGVELYAATVKWPPKDATPGYGTACVERPIEAMHAEALAHR